jgi:AGCS family alanine or glycine:cation symporter
MEAAIRLVIDPLNNILWSYVLIYVLIGVGLVLTVASGFVQLRGLRYSFKAFKKLDDSGISPTQAFATGLASRVGTGNIAGVATAIALGGPGAVFWMWVTALIGMASAFTESTLAQIYKERHPDGSFRGGPAYYIQRGLGSRGWGIAFAVALIIAFGLVFNAVQANSISDTLHVAYGWNKAAIGAVLVVLSAGVIFGGLRRIGTVAEWMVPLMAVGYLMVAVYAVVTHFALLPEVLGLIMRSAFGLEPAVGGVMGYGIMQAMTYGVKRGLFSNEAGMGSAPNAAATATTPHPASQGLLQMFGVFVDTIIICSATAFIVLLSGVFVPGSEIKGAALTQAAVTVHIGPAGKTFMSFAVFFFAFTSIIGNYAYAEGNVEFIKRSRRLVNVFRFLVLGMVMFGAVASVPLVWDMADVSMGFMALINLVAIFLLRGKAVAAWKDYTGQLARGVRIPEFSRDVLPDGGHNLPNDVWPGSRAALKPGIKKPGAGTPSGMKTSPAR